MRDQLKNEFEASIELLAGSGGVFTVAVDDIEVFSKKKAAPFPTLSEITSLIKQQMK